MTTHEDATGELAGAVRALAAARATVSRTQEAAAALREELARTKLGRQLAETEEALQNARQVEARARAELDALALMRYAAQGDKRPHPAILVREMTRLDYDAKTARDWAETNLRAALVLDYKKFERAVKQLGAPDFVRVYTEPRVTVSSDLSSYAL